MAEIEVAESKAFYMSKTFWVNLISIVAIIAQSQFGWIVSPEIQVSVLAAINVGLRLITKQPVAWTGENTGEGK